MVVFLGSLFEKAVQFNQYSVCGILLSDKYLDKDFREKIIQLLLPEIAKKAFYDRQWFDWYFSLKNLLKGSVGKYYYQSAREHSQEDRNCDAYGNYLLHIAALEGSFNPVSAINLHVWCLNHKGKTALDIFTRIRQQGEYTELMRKVGLGIVTEAVKNGKLSVFVCNIISYKEKYLGRFLTLAIQLNHFHLIAILCSLLPIDICIMLSEEENFIKDISETTKTSKSLLMLSSYLYQL